MTLRGCLGDMGNSCMNPPKKTKNKYIIKKKKLIQNLLKLKKKKEKFISLVEPKENHD